MAPEIFIMRTFMFVTIVNNQRKGGTVLIEIDVAVVFCHVKKVYLYIMLVNLWEPGSRVQCFEKVC